MNLYKRLVTVNYTLILGDNLNSHSIWGIKLKIVIRLNTSAVIARNLETIGY